MLLISRQGDILFSIAAQDDLGTNLFHGAHAGTRFAAAVRKTLEDGYSTFSDLELYGPSGGEPASFLIQAMVDEDGERVGAMAVQHSLALVDRLMHDTVGLGRDGESYLIGADGLLRSNSRFCNYRRCAPTADRQSSRSRLVGQRYNILRTGREQRQRQSAGVLLSQPARRACVRRLPPL